MICGVYVMGLAIVTGLGMKGVIMGTNLGKMSKAATFDIRLFPAVSHPRPCAHNIAMATDWRSDPTQQATTSDGSR